MWQKLSALPVLAFVVFLEPLQALAQAQQDSPSPRQWYGPGPGHMWSDGYGFWWGGPFMMLFWIAVIAAVIYLLVRAAQRPNSDRRWSDRYESDPAHSALQILNERFARGEIQKPEYEEKKSALLSGMRR